jgi:hypothetical protein|tara:strand:- start:429 stop:941 length:513 start_codon:yes stop_codon:yes gene_type:complete
MYIVIGGDGKEYGPKAYVEVRDWITEGRLNAQSQIKEQGDNEWKVLGSLQEFTADFAGSNPAVSQTGMTPPPQIQQSHHAGYSQPYAQVTSPRIPNYLVQSILVTLCCCMPFGIAAIVYASKVEGLERMGDIAGAQEASGKAKMWCWIGFGVGIPANIAVFSLQVAAESF